MVLELSHIEAITSLLIEMNKDTLVKYASSHGLKISGTKRTIIKRILESNTKVSIRMMAPPSGIISIGIALYNDDDIES